MNTQALNTEITHLDHTPDCTEWTPGRHGTNRPQAHWWIPGHGCTDELWCNRCLLEFREQLAFEGICRCTCGYTATAERDLLGDVKPIRAA